MSDEITGRIISAAIEVHKTLGPGLLESIYEEALCHAVQDLQVDAEVNPSSLRVRIKSSKTDPFHQGCFIYLGRGQITLSRPWAGGPVMHINFTLEPQRIQILEVSGRLRQ